MVRFVSLRRAKDTGKGARGMPGHRRARFGYSHARDGGRSHERRRVRAVSNELSRRDSHTMAENGRRAATNQHAKFWPREKKYVGTGADFRRNSKQYKATTRRMKQLLARLHLKFTRWIEHEHKTVAKFLVDRYDGVICPPLDRAMFVHQANDTPAHL